MKAYLLFLTIVLYNPLFAIQENTGKKESVHGNYPVKAKMVQFGKFVGNVALATGISYCTTLANTFFHELGHAMVRKAFTGEPIIIYLGTTAADSIKPGIHLSGFNPLIGVSHFNPYLKTTPGQEILICLAGPIMGIVTAYLCNKILNNQKLLPPLTTQLCKDLNYTNYIDNLAQLIPYRDRTDGGAITKYLNILDFEYNGELTNPTA